MKPYLPSRYWKDRMRKNFDLTGVGHSQLGLNYNTGLYQRRLETLSAGLARIKQPLAGMRVLTESAPIHTGNYFDIVFAVDVLFHIVADERFERALASMASYLTSGGWLIISDVFPTRTVQTAAHVRLRAFDDYHQILQRHHFNTFHIEPIFAILQPPPTTSQLIWWNLYAFIWKFEQHLIKNVFLDSTLPYLLGWLDRHLFCPRYGTKVPNSKWLFARKA